ncbi:MAG: adenylate/guanylate cyclase domain-containing protein [Spirulinaceae cyanobacterium RM2_2_10]|nr:adenylate/guanylate cyclase domain-containing protein [Spirulinaceae cyanobacterium SM2_1_0]NJO20512.1 adenylate/guanylate cyclase domain-containing protein [Spirulinaceae cyanobacterium RM2_2_10]
MPAFAPTHLRSLLKARLSRRIALWVFASIVFIEIVILIPSYWREEKRQLQQLREVSQSSINTIAFWSQQDIGEKKFFGKVEILLSQSDIIKGVAVYNAKADLVDVIGFAPELRLPDLDGKLVNSKRSASGQYYDVVWSGRYFNTDYSLITRLDASSVQVELYKFVGRIAILVIVIAVFVTATTMIVLGHLAIAPVLHLRDDLMRAGDALSQDQTQGQFYSFDCQRQDELGEVMRAFRQMFERVAWEISQRKKIETEIRLEREKAEQLLLNILPESIATTLKERNGTIAQGFEEVTILFADIVDFTKISAQISPAEVVSLLNQIFSRFDDLCDHLGLEKIKTIGDNYMVAAGLPIPRADHAEAIADMALAMRKAIADLSDHLGRPLSLRIGINTGSVVAGVIGTKKFIYDLWGDAVNVASRMESQGIAGSIQVTAATYEKLRDQYWLEERGTIEVKGKGAMQTYLLLGKRLGEPTSPPLSSTCDT